MTSLTYTILRHQKKLILVGVEVALVYGLPNTELLGLPSKALQESVKRVNTVLRILKLKLKKLRTVINLYPSQLTKQGLNIDLALMASLLKIHGYIDDDLSECCFLGEVGLDGSVLESGNSQILINKLKGTKIKYVFLAGDSQFDLYRSGQGLVVIKVNNVSELLNFKTLIKKNQKSVVVSDDYFFTVCQAFYHLVESTDNLIELLFWIIARLFNRVFYTIGIDNSHLKDFLSLLYFIPASNSLSSHQPLIQNYEKEKLIEYFFNKLTKTNKIIACSSVKTNIPIVFVDNNITISQLINNQNSVFAKIDAVSDGFLIYNLDQVNKKTYKNLTRLLKANYQFKNSGAMNKQRVFGFLEPSFSLIINDRGRCLSCGGLQAHYSNILTINHDIGEKICTCKSNSAIVSEVDRSQIIYDFNALYFDFFNLSLEKQNYKRDLFTFCKNFLVNYFRLLEDKFYQSDYWLENFIFDDWLANVVVLSDQKIARLLFNKYKSYKKIGDIALIANTVKMLLGKPKIDNFCLLLAEKLVIYDAQSNL